MSEFRLYAEALRPEVEATLDRLLPPADAEPARLHAAMRYSVFAGGKRIRPSLAVLAGETYGAPRPLLLAGAAALELIHTFSLVHDDLPALDDDDLRRGRPTVHRRYDEATAILAGDALSTLGLTVLAREPEGVSGEVRRAAVELVGEEVGTRGMIGGQMSDLEAEDRWPDQDAGTALASIHRRKTGALMAASLRLGGLYAGAGAEAQALLGALGHQLGMLFQIADDILDIEGSAETLGKTARKDAGARKLTYPGLYGLEESRRLLGRVRDEALDLAGALPGAGGLFPSLISYLATRDR